MLGGTVADDCDVPPIGRELLPVSPPNKALDVVW